MRSANWLLAVLVVVMALALVGGPAWAATVDVSAVRNITNTGTANGYYERDPELLVASSGTWYLVYARSQTEFTAGGNPDGLKYDTYYQTSTDNGATWTAAAKVLDAAAIAAASTFRSATVCEADGQIWVIGADCKSLEGDIYANTYSGGSWSGQSMIFDGTYATGAFHVDAVTEGDDIRLFYGIQSESEGVGFIKYDGDTNAWDAAVTKIGATAGWQIPRVIKDGSTYYLVSTDWEHILFTSTTTPDDVPWPDATEVTSAPSGGASSDPCILKYGSSGGTDDLIVFHAPWYADDSQPEEYVYSTDGGATWSGSTAFTDARHTVGSSWDMMPRAYMKDASTIMSFFGMEKRGGARSQADIVVTEWSATATVGHAHYTTVQDGIDNASPNDIVAVAAGLYPERLTIPKSLDLRGAQYGVDPTPTLARTNMAAESIITEVGTGTPNPDVLIDVTAGGTGLSVDGFTLKGDETNTTADTSVLRCWAGGLSVTNNIITGMYGLIHKGGDSIAFSENRVTVNKAGAALQPNPTSNVVLSGNVVAVGSAPQTDMSGIYMTSCTTAEVSGNVISGFNGRAVQGSACTAVNIVGNTFSSNRDGLSFFGGTTFLTAADNDITNSTRYGVNVKGQDVSITGNRITGSGDSGIFIDRNVIDTQRVVVSENDLSGSTNYGIKVVTAVVTETVDASGNWWGTTDAATVRAKANAGVGADYSPWLAGGTPLSPGFDGDYSTLWVDGDSPRVGATGYVQEGVSLVSGSTVNVLDGIYDETITFAPAFAKNGLVIDGVTPSRPVVNGGVRFQNTGALTGITLRDLYLKGTVAGQNRVIANDNAGAVYGFTLDGCVLDGENVADRCGIAGNLYGGALTITGCEFKNLLGFAVMDIDSSSDYSPYGGNGLPFTTVTFSDNDVHDCNGTVSLRGHYPTRTTQVNVHDNTFTNIGGNEGQAGEQWAAIEVNHTAALSFHGNVIDDVVCGSWSEGQAVQMWDVGTIDMHGNSFANCYQGLYVFGGSAGGDFGGPYAVPAGSMSYNNISGNTEYGLKVQDTATGGPLDAEMNWWGDATGPEVSKGTGDPVEGDVDYDPWIGKSGGENVICDPDPLSLKVGATTGQVAVKYLGGGGGLVFGYSVMVSWDAAKVSLTGITEGGLLKDAVPPDGTFFFVYGTGNTRTIDCSILGSLVHPGVTGPGTMFTLNFSAVGYGESPVDVTIIAFRDNTNTNLFGFFEDDGLITVDITNPVVTDVHIANLSPPTDDYAKNHDNLELTATVTDDYPLAAADITADLSLLLSGGGTAVVAQSYDPGTHVATWTTVLADVTLTPDGSKSVTVTAEDGLGNIGTGSDAIIVDNTLPGSVEGFAAAPGHQKVHLSWSDASGKDANYSGVLVRYEAWGDYPEYETAPAYPASYTGGDGDAFSGTGTVATHVIVPPDIHYYSAFVYDLALNYGPVTSAGQDRATNYWLGDVASGFGVWGYDGLVSDNDINSLGGQYGQVPTGDFNRCDVGPSDDHSRLGIPLPNDFINFEDLMMFAMNYGAVSPAGKVIPFLPEAGEGALALSLEELVRSPEGEVQVALRLGGNVDDVKGISTVITYDATELEFVSARLSDAMVSPLAEMFFWSGTESGKAQVDLAVLGTGVAIGGSGDVAVLTFRALGGEYALGFDEALIRGVENDELTADLEGLESRPEVPTVFRLSQNVPNPFNPKTVVAYEVPQVSEVTIRVYDVAGKLVRTLVDGTVDPGRYAATWDGRNDTGAAVGSGVYFCVMDTPVYHATNKMMLLK